MVVSVRVRGYLSGMCGRFTLFTPPEDILATFGIDTLPKGFTLAPRFNIAPSQDIAIIRADEQQRHIGPARWGLVPGWSKEARPRYSTINARIESVAEKPAYRVPFRRRRCLIPADGFYEWAQRSEGKIPHYICRQDRKLLAFAGLWDHWSGDDEAFDSCVIITAPAQGVMQSLHSRMPVILDATAWDGWLDPACTAPEEVATRLVPAPADSLAAWPVSTWVNSPAHDAPRCLEAP